VGMLFPLLNCLRTYGIANHLLARSIAGLCIYNLKIFMGVIFPGVLPLDPCRSDPGAWTHTSISAWLAIVPIVPVLRKDRCDDDDDDDTDGVRRLSLTYL